MKENFDGGSAFPEPVPSQCGGMTLRDYFAAKALQGLLSFSGSQRVCSYHEATTAEATCATAYAYADAMIAARGDV